MKQRKMNAREFSQRYKRALRNLDPLEDLKEFGIEVTGPIVRKKRIPVKPLFGLRDSATFNWHLGLYKEGDLRLTLVDILYRLYPGKLLALKVFCERAGIDPPKPWIKGSEIQRRTCRDSRPAAGNQENNL